jgi:DNA invertase Pin-like site-specific DNA recombinase
MGKWVSYLRVSTDKQGRSGLGIEAQRAAVENYIRVNNGRGGLVAEYVEVESGKKTKNRPQLEAAFGACKLYGGTLLIAKLDRLSRDAHFLLGLEKAGIDFIACDMPHANRLTVGIMALVAEEEGRAISRRTKEALAMAKARGTKIGGQRIGRDGKPLVITLDAAAMGRDAQREKANVRADQVGAVFRELQAQGKTTLREIAEGLNVKEVPTARGKGKWGPEQVKRVLGRL